MTHYIIPYVDPNRNDGEEDPMFNEFTYGDKGERGKKLLERVKHGDYLFFHTSKNGKRYITAFYKVDRVLPIEEARASKLISGRYENPHLLSQEVRPGEAIVFGNPLGSLELVTPLELSLELLSDLGFPHNPAPSQSVYQYLTSAFRSWRELSDSQAEQLVSIILNLPQQVELNAQTQLSSEEIPLLREKDIEDLLAASPELIDLQYVLLERQFVLPGDNKGRRLDLLLEHKATGEHAIVEIKKGPIGLDATKQLEDYIKLYKASTGHAVVQGILVGNGILPRFEEDVTKKVKDEGWLFFDYGWTFSLRKVIR